MDITRCMRCDAEKLKGYPWCRKCVVEMAQNLSGQLALTEFQVRAVLAGQMSDIACPWCRDVVYPESGVICCKEMAHAIETILDLIEQEDCVEEVRIRVREAKEMEDALMKAMIN